MHTQEGGGGGWYIGIELIWNSKVHRFLFYFIVGTHEALDHLASF